MLSLSPNNKASYSDPFCPEFLIPLSPFSKLRVTTYSRCFDPVFEKAGPKDHFAIYLLV